MTGKYYMNKYTYIAIPIQQLSYWICPGSWVILTVCKNVMQVFLLCEILWLPHDGNIFVFSLVLSLIYFQ